MTQPYELTVSQAAQQIKDKKLSPVDLAQSLLERIDATDKVCTLGGPDHQPVVGDWDGDGADEVGVFRDGGGEEE